MQNLKPKLQTFLKSAKRIAIVAIGSELRADDAAGTLVALYLEQNFQEKKNQPKLEAPQSRTRGTILFSAAEHPQCFALRGLASPEIRNLAEKPRRREQSERRRVKVFYGATAPENLTGEIREFKPTHIIMVDAADTGKKPGTISFFKSEELDGVSFCTHQLPLNVLAIYLLGTINPLGGIPRATPVDKQRKGTSPRRGSRCDIIVIGIQPKTVIFGKPVSREVETSAQKISKAIIEAIS